MPIVWHTQYALPIARRHFANAIKAIGKGNQETVKSSVAYKALMRIATIYKLEGALKDFSPGGTPERTAGFNQTIG